ncbi:MAG: hypothetical protein GY863_23110, partial [bacterium]|nr:hypothetical protein [bacterium]
LISQFMGETIFLTLIAAAAAVFIVFISLPYFNNFINKELELNIAGNLSYVLWLAGIVLFVSVVSGSYSALFLSSFSPIKVIKGKIINIRSRHQFRSLLVIFQFCITVFLIGGTVVVYDQMQYIKNKDMGFSREQIIVIPVEDNFVKRGYTTIKNELIQNHNILKVTSSGSLPYGFTNRNTTNMEREDGEFSELPHFTGYVDQDFIDLFGLQLLKGRNFSDDIPTDVSQGFIVNELLVEKMGWKEPIGKRIRFGETEGRVIGVVRNFHHYSLHHEIKPVIMKYFKNRNRIQYISIKIRPDNINDTVDLIRSTVDQYSVNHPYNYYFMDDAFNEMYLSEQKLGSIFRVFTFIAIFISCLGLFGLVSFLAEQNRKEISIRKVLGASVPKLVSLISFEFIKYTLIADIIALPAVFYLMNNWLNGFTYRIDLGIEFFMFSAGMGILIALLTVGYKSVRSAVSNPVDSLRYE